MKEAYHKLENQDKYNANNFSFELPGKDQYKLLFFQHFLDLSIIDDDIKADIIDFIPKGINCSFKNDIIKSTNDFVSTFNDFGYNKMTKEINIFMRGLSESKFKNARFIYEIFTSGLKNRTDQFNFFNIISDEKEFRISKSNYGKLLIDLYPSKKLSQTETEIIKKANQIILELEKEDIERKKVEEEKKIQKE